MDRPLSALSLIDAVKGIAEKRFTSEEYTRALLARISLDDEEIRAWAWFEPEAALRAARLSDRRLKEGEAPGPLQGIPVGVKDIYATAGVPTEMGSPAFAGNIPEKSARVVERLQEQGAFVMGKTVTAECAFYAPGKTRNPWNILHTPGGSSSGSAAAVAAGFVPAAIGTQTNGSVIRPAAFCGIVGFKPTQGVIPVEGALTFSHTLDQPGVFTRSVADAAWFAASLSAENAHISPAIVKRGASPFLAAIKTPVWEQADEHARQNFQNTIARLRTGGARVEECELPESFELAQGTIQTLMAAEAAFNMEELALSHAPLLSATLRDIIAKGSKIGVVAYQQALSQRLRLRDELRLFLARFDAIITPPATGEAPATLAQTGNPAFCSIWSLCGVPAVTIPTGLGPRGLPLGLQIVGAAGNDDLVLSTALWCEERLPFPVWTPFHARG
ncbi:MAG: amidase [Syntrophales bacterium]|jgi:Asp-tRNA(Asn)/Glu-tRNA(Gln) amidotransferase A subunit family amidase|nr:amidase [Syntrophales bacterium]